MRKLGWMLVAVCLLSLPSWGQMRRRGYTPAGGWHRKSVPPATAPRETKKKSDKRAPQPPSAAPATPSR